MPADTETPVTVAPATPSNDSAVAAAVAPAPAKAEPVAPVAAPVSAPAAVAAAVKPPKAAPARLTGRKAKVAKTPAGKSGSRKVAAASPAPAAVAAPVAAAKTVKSPAPVVARRKAVATAPAAPAKVRRQKAGKIITPTQAAPISRPLPLTKEKTMASQAFDFVAPIKTAFADMQEKAKTVYEKSTVSLTEANDFAKGNVEAMVESGKILASGLQELGATAMTESRTAFETLSTEIKSLATAKSPTEFFQLQSALLRKHFDVAVAQTSKSTEAMLKLANDSMAPISSRVTVAVEKVSKVA